jgi:hypothetical protein
MSSGELPLREDFDRMFALGGGTFPVGNCQRHGTRSFTADELWAEIEYACSDKGQTECFDGCDHEMGCSADCPVGFASSVLTVLGFEWV